MCSVGRTAAEQLFLLSRFLNGNARGAPSSLDGAPWASQSANSAVGLPVSEQPVSEQTTTPYQYIYIYIYYVSVLSVLAVWHSAEAFD